MYQATSEMNPQQHTSASDMDARDSDFTPQDSSSQEDAAPVSRRAPSGLNPHNMTREYHYATTLHTSNMQSTHSRVPSRQAYGQPDRPHYSSPTRQSPSLLKQFTGYFNRSTGSSSAAPDLEQQIYLRDIEIERLREDLRGRHNIVEQISKDHRKDVDHLKEKHQKILDDVTRKWDAREKELERYNQQIRYDRDESIRRLQAEVREIESDRHMIQEKYDTFIRKQQEESFKKMESGRWLPSEESKVVGDLDRIKREMRTWAKGAAIKDMPLQKIDQMEVADLMKDLSHVVLLKNNQLPQGLSTPKSPSLLLNALLAHHVYTNIFRNPFFFLKDELGQDMARAGLEDALDEIYQLAQASNQQDAHIWRSQTLRLLLPPMRTDSRDGEKTLKRWTEGMIARVSERQALDFIGGPARHLISNDAITSSAKKLKDIYQEAAATSYRLWTRRTTMKCLTLHEMGQPTFDPDSTYLVPHTLVRYDDHDDQLRNKEITVIVHPLLKVYGTDEATDYGEGRVWAPAEVWLDSK